MWVRRGWFFLTNNFSPIFTSFDTTRVKGTSELLPYLLMLMNDDIVLVATFFLCFWKGPCNDELLVREKLILMTKNVDLVIFFRSRFPSKSLSRRQKKKTTSQIRVSRALAENVITGELLQRPRSGPKTSRPRVISSAISSGRTTRIFWVRSQIPDKFPAEPK